MLTTKSVITHSKKQIGVEIDGQIVLMNVEKNNYFNLDEMGSYIWRLLDKPQSINSICDSLETTFEVDRVTCEKEVLTFLHKLVDSELIETNVSHTLK